MRRFPPGGPPGPAAGEPRPWRVVALLVGFLALAACQDAASGTASTPTPAGDPRQALSTALAGVSPQDAQLAMDPATAIRVMTAPFFHQYRIYALEQRSGFHPTLRYIGYAPGQPVYLLPGLPANYVRLAQADGVRLGAPADAVAYIDLYLEVTRTMQELFYVLRSPDDLLFVSDLRPDEAQTKQAFLGQYGTTIRPPAGQARGANFEVTVYTAREQAVERHVFAVSADGGIEDAVTVLAGNLPLATGR